MDEELDEEEGDESSGVVDEYKLGKLECNNCCCCCCCTTD